MKSYSHAQNALRLIAENGMSAEMGRLSPEAGGSGCGYYLQYNQDDSERIKRLLKI